MRNRKKNIYGQVFDVKYFFADAWDLVLMKSRISVWEKIYGSAF